MVEFAIALPLLLLLLLAVAEFGRMLSHYNSLLQANRDAARYLAVMPGTATSVGWRSAGARGHDQNLG